MWLALPLAAFANSSIDFTDHNGTLTGTSSGLSLSGSTVSSIAGWSGSGTVQGDLGTVSLTTGALLGGSLQTGGTFASGGTFTIKGDGLAGIPNGTVFSGTFTSPVTWTMTTLANGTHQYTLTGTLSGTLYGQYGGEGLTGVTTKLTFNTGSGYFNGWSSVANGETTITTVAVPEPSTLSFIGMGLIGVVGLVRRKTKIV
jgi:hypothetical protein